jgi:hypothetical protein
MEEGSMITKIRVLLLFFLFFLISATLYAQVYTWASFPQMAAGGGYTTYITISDPLQGDFTSRTVGISFYTPNGDPLTVTVNQGIGATSSFEFPLPDLGEKTYAVTSSTLVTGRIEIYAEGVAKFNSSVRYTVTDSTGKIMDAVGVLPTSFNYSWTITLDKQDASQNVGVAIANWWSDVDTVVKFDLYTNGSTLTISTTETVRALGQLAIYAAGNSGLFPSFTGLGTLRISCSDAPISVMAMRQDGTQFSSLPADAGVQLWSWSYTANSTTYSGDWSWRFTDEPTFVGSEYNSWNDSLIAVRGLYDKTRAPFPFFILEWWYANSQTDSSDQGTVLFQGTPGTEGGGEVINGTRTAISVAGEVQSSYPFKATRIY